MTTRELIDRADILEVWVGLGGGALRRNKSCAWWRESSSWSVSLSPEKNAWFDFSPHQGGGVLRLVEVARNCDRSDALAWLAVFYSVELDNAPLSIEARRAWRKRRSEAEARAAELVAWREDLLSELRQRRDAIWECVRAAERFGKAFVGEPGRDDLWNFAFECIAEEPEGERLEEWIIRIEGMHPGELVALRRRMTAREAIAA